MKESQVFKLINTYIKSKWIDVNIKLPDVRLNDVWSNQVYILCTDNNGEYHIKSEMYNYLYKRWGNENEYNIKNLTVKYWMSSKDYEYLKEKILFITF